MANQKHVDILEQGVEVWNNWVKENRSITADLRYANLRYANLSGAYLSGANLRYADLSRAYLSRAYLSRAYLGGANLGGANLSGANLRYADLSGANLRGADLSGAYLSRAYLSDADLISAYLSGADLISAYLSGADLSRANLSDANLSGADLISANLSGTKLSDADLSSADLSSANLSGADLSSANLSGADLSSADLGGADLTRVSLINTNLTNANLTGCSIFGISAWDVNVEGAVQKDLIITRDGESEITVDNLEVAQFIYLLLNNAKIRDVIDTITSKVVLILGRFTDERKPVLNALRDELRNYNYSPVVFDFDPSAKRDLTETISLLARMSRFIIADLTDAKSLPQELENTVPHLPSVPVQPILQKGATEYSMFEHYERYPWVLPIYHYQDISSLLASIKEHIILSIEQKKGWKDEKSLLEEKVRILEEENKRLKGGM